jgi:TonB-linked SusC/RagA family outer membrane protein
MLLFIFLATVSEVYAQRTVTGQITSMDDSQPLPGASVVIKGTTTGTVTDIDGNYSIEVKSDDDVLVVSMVGMLDEEIKVSDRTIIDISLVTDLIGLEEVIVIGYGTMKKNDIAGSIVSVKGDDLIEVKSNNLLESLQGKVAGLDVTPSSGRAGDGVDMLVRGKRSLNATSDPLIIVDGIPVSSDIGINPNDIESLEILKDASSTAIYGSRGANGIILITTKKGTKGTSKVYYNGYYSLSDPYQQVPVFDREGYIKAKTDAYRDINNWEVTPDPSEVFGSDEIIGYDKGTETNWQDLITRRGYQQDHHLGVTGGNDKVNYNTSLAYFHEKGVVIADEFKRYSAQINLDAKVTKRISAGTSTFITHKIFYGANRELSNVSTFTNALKLPPIVAAYDSLGQYIYEPASPNPRKSPLAKLKDVEENRETSIFSNIYGSIKIIEGLELRSTLGVKYKTSRRGYMYPQKAPEEALTESGVEFNLNGGYTWNNVLTFDKTFNKNHIIFTGAHEMQKNQIEPYLFTGFEQDYERSLWYNMGTNKNPTQESGFIESSMVSFLGRLNYTYNEKYILSAAVRADGASQLAKGHKWDYFPAFSTAWRVNQEPFLAGAENVLSDMKLRVSYGRTGNASINPYSVFPGNNIYPNFIQFGDPGSEIVVFSYRPTSLAAVSLAWEKTDQINFGIDFGLFKNRIYGNIDVYLAETNNILMEDKLPTSTGFYSVYANSAQTHSKGIELTLQTINVSASDFTWKTNITFFASHEEITKLVSGIEQDISNGWFVGEPIDVFYDYKKTGIWQLDEPVNVYGEEFSPGDIKVEDVDGNDTINELDKTVLGTPRPKWSGTIDNTVTYKGISLSFSIYAKWGQMIDADAYDFDPRMLSNMLAIDYWTPVNPSNENPRLGEDLASAPFASSTMHYRDGSFIKLRQVTLAYQIPSRVLKKLPISSINFYLSSKNTAILYSKMAKGVDPERNGSIDWPLSRLFTFGIDVEF